MLNPTLIQQFNSSPHALLNDGNLEQLREVMKELFPKDEPPTEGLYKIYKVSSWRKTEWAPQDETELPIIPVTSFFTPPDKIVKVSDVVAWVEENAIEVWDINENRSEAIDYNSIKQYLNELP